MIDMSRYFGLIGYQHQDAPTGAALREIHLRHTQTIPFENLTPLTGMPVRLDLPSLLAKFTQRRGGYCYEQNLLFQHALDTLGFKTRALLARVRMNVPSDVVAPRTHMLVLVEADGETWIADTGFGRMTLTAPIRLQPDLVQATPHGAYRLVNEDGAYCLQAEVAGKWEQLYVFDLAPCFLSDIEMSNWYVSTHPGSHFVHDLVAVKTVSGGRHVLNNTRYTYYEINSEPTYLHLARADDIIGLLDERFGIDAARMPGLHDRLDGIVRKRMQAD